MYEEAKPLFGREGLAPRIAKGHYREIRMGEMIQDGEPHRAGAGIMFQLTKAVNCFTLELR